jgi:hypothetical protein
MTDAEYLAQLEAVLTPDLKAAIHALLNATPDASEAKVIALLRDRFPDVYEKNRPVLVEMGLFNVIQTARNQRNQTRTIEPAVVYRGFLPEIDVPSDRSDWGPENYATYANAIIAFHSYLIDEWGPAAELSVAFGMAEADRLRGECCLRFGLFPPRFDSMQLKIPVWLAHMRKPGRANRD